MPSGKPATSEQTRRFHHLLQQGHTIKDAAQAVGMSPAWGYEQNKGLPANNTAAREAVRRGRDLEGPVPYGELCEQARRAWDDFGFFCRRYVGLVLRPWQTETADNLIDWMASDDRVYVVENCPPGVGKTTLTYALAAWLTVRDRRIRGLIGSRAESNAKKVFMRLRRLLERESPVRARPEWIEAGIACDAESTLAKDFGRFRPDSSEVWRSDACVVVQEDNRLIEEREPTWSAYGMDSGVLGNRFDIIIWDDVVDKKTIQTAEAQEKQRQWWDDEAETRLEPGGVMLLVGQRMDPNDLYRYCLDKKVYVEDWDDQGLDALGRSFEDDRPSLYKHIIYKAHYDGLCDPDSTHRRSSPPWPDGCLLDPHRVPWTDLRNKRETAPSTFKVQFQQEDADPDDVLVPSVWIWGGIDPDDGSDLPGCVDNERDICSPLPANLYGNKTSLATVDPSGTKKWAIQWWVTVHNDQFPQHFLMDLESKSMPANELLDWNANERQFYGVMETWQARSVQMGKPITHWIIEDNAAQRYLLVYDHVRRWKAKWGVNIVPHNTGPQHYKKIDNERGPSIMRDAFRHGRVRLPGKQPPSKARIKTLKLVQELTRWPHAGTDDQVMAAWFHFLHLPRIHRPATDNPRMWRPTWMTDEDDGWAA